MLKTEKSRISFFSWLAIIMLVLVGVRVAYLQTVMGKFYADYAANQSKGVLESSKGRGLILDTEGNPLALNKKSASLFVFPAELTDRYGFIEKLRNAGVKLSYEKRRKILHGNSFVWLVRNISVQDADRIKADVPKVESILEEQRFYPERSLAAAIVGFTGVDNKGLNGIEYRYDNILEGRKFKMLSLKDNKHKRIILEDPEKKKQIDTEIYLTIDKHLQGLTEEILREDTATFQAERGMAIAMDVRTGNIIMAASSGGFDPNDFRDYPSAEWKDYPASFLYEPGSIFKPVLFSLMLDKHNLSPNELVNCENGLYTIHRHTIKDDHPSGIISMAQVMIRSSNIGMAKLSDRISKEEFYNYITNAGFGHKTGTPGLIEEEGLVRGFKEWSGLSKPSISIGQEILVTPLQMVRFYGAIADGGVLKNPKLIKKVIKGIDTYTPKDEERRIFSESTAHQLQQLLKRVVKEGTGINAYSDYVDIGGKTGTGQRIDKTTGTYSKSEYVASFAGVFPADNPRIAMVVVYKEPHSSIYGGATAAKSFKTLAEQISMYLGLKRSYVYESGPAS